VVDIRCCTKHGAHPDTSYCLQCVGAGPVCSTCNERHVPCTQCPTPCQNCRGKLETGGYDAYCAQTPCPCPCHTSRHSVPTTERSPGRRRAIGTCAQCAAFEEFEGEQIGFCTSKAVEIQACQLVEQSCSSAFGCIHWVAREPAKSKGGAP
jgi:hypothetical protein